MDKCPPEIHARIFSYACTDDGTTGCHLSLVSRYIHQVSSPYRWQCLALAGFKHVAQFADVLEGVKQKRPIYHLFLSDRRPYVIDTQTNFDHFMEYDTKFVPAMMQILRLAGPTLQTLSLFSEACFVDGAMAVKHCLSIPYPQLKELTLRACCTPSQLTGTFRGDTIPCNTPELTLLHLALPYHGFSSDNLQATHNLVQSISPNVEQLRFTMLDKWGNRRVVEVIHSELADSGIVSDVLDLPPSDWDSPRIATAHPVTWDRLLPENLKLFAIQPSPTSTFYCSCCMDLRGDVDVMRILERMSDLADKERFLYMDRRPIRVRKCRTDPLEVAGYGHQEARSDWMERIDEGNGCWKQRDDLDCDANSQDGRTQLRSPPAFLLVPKRKKMRRVTRLKNMFKKLKVW
ncbi:hypothetical protein BDW22DRAFT_1370326 [Trametopsis cervina]|nr:hypothetical protein BDW22DRAFT_1370326 [Trametopsis cervina]